MSRKFIVIVSGLWVLSYGAMSYVAISQSLRSYNEGFQAGQKDGLKRCQQICNVKFKFEDN